MDRKEKGKNTNKYPASAVIEKKEKQRKNNDKTE